LEEMSSDRMLFSAILGKHLASPGVLDKKHYPVVAMDIELNPFYGLVANCWIPLPGRETHISTKTLHHHGNMLLTTTTIFGPGYEHWTLTKPTEVSPDGELFSTKLIERRPHPQGHVAFVDSYVAHIPFYMSSLTITLALWSNKFPTTWRDRLKRVPFIEKRKDTLLRLTTKAGLTKALDIKTIEYFDFYPTAEGLKGMKERREFELGPNSDYLYSLFHIIQQTGNEKLTSLVRRQLVSYAPPGNNDLVRRLLEDIEHGNALEGRLSDCHFGIPYANFTKKELERAVGIE
jgi:hypothetical protein